MNNYTEAIEYLFARLPMFTRDGASAINKGLDRVIQLCAYLDNPQQHFKTIHIAGTNGKGSSSHMITAVLEAAGFKTGLYTSPHLIDFRERIRVHGIPVSEGYVLDFINTHRAFIEEIQPSFFELTVGMAFDYFAKQQVDIAIIEVGLGGRLDSTNIIAPLVSLITNIGMDHMDMLGNNLVDIASEKAGIIKNNTPVIISEYHDDTQAVFRSRAEFLHAPITFATDRYDVIPASVQASVFQSVQVIGLDDTALSLDLELDLMGSYQVHNLKGVLCVLQELQKQGFSINEAHIKTGLREVQQRTGLMGRWQTISTLPYVICDTGHNEDGIQQVVKNLSRTPHRQLHVVIGAMKDKDLGHILPLLPTDAIYYFCAPALPRSMHAAVLKDLASQYDLIGDCHEGVIQAYQAALSAWQSEDLVFVGGSTFVVAEVLTFLQQVDKIK